jgi:hypothetical protein
MDVLVVAREISYDVRFSENEGVEKCVRWRQYVLQPRRVENQRRQTQLQDAPQVRFSCESPEHVQHTRLNHFICVWSEMWRQHCKLRLAQWQASHNTSEKLISSSFIPQIAILDAA